MKTSKLLKDGLKELEIPCSEEQISTFMIYLSELKKWSRTYNLTALKTDEDIVIKHFLDSLLYLKAIPPGPIKLADAGTGAGFPGLPIKIIRPEIEVTLVEPARKKTAFLRHMIRLIQLNNISVSEQRLENMGQDHYENYDIIVTRATFSIKEFRSIACPFVRKKGSLIVNKGPKVSDELIELEKSLPAGYKVDLALRLNLPFANTTRNLLVLSC